MCKQRLYCKGPDVFHSIPVWLWAVVGVSVLVFVALVLLLLGLLQHYQSKKERAKVAQFFEDNEEFGKYAVAEPANHFYSLTNPTSTTFQGSDGPSSVVYLTTPDYKESSALANSRPPSWRNSSQSKLKDFTLSDRSLSNIRE
ncbi:hypothetical protein EC973_005680 [Apophysomyces ossiformis]|uniref:Uncharacterized protein n=1 Tax=Apophysomyces ossiformis TaxID=679940 RepID=A0A8H7BP52_9FUNG|nr:hypothetical protein EC973_005680 [Apophysomyces ossiformis]